MGLLDPTLPDFDLEDWARQPMRERVRLMCQSWAMQGFGAPVAVYAFYVVKIAIYIGVWILLCVNTTGLGGISNIGTWWAEPLAFQKAVLWTLLFEGLGLGCATGPLTARYLPPFGGFLHFARPGTTRLPPWPRLPLTAGHRRTFLDVGLYAANVVLILRALVADDLATDMLLPIVVVLGILGLRDKTVFLAHRSEHYLLTVVVFLFMTDIIPGSKIIQWALWWGAATSKLNHHFPSVVAVMVSNSPVLRWKALRRAMYAGYPDDLRPSRLATWLAHVGTVIEYGFPLLLVFGGGGPATTIGLMIMLGFHTYIASSFPLAVPIEWNVFFLYSGFALFGAHAEISVFSIESPLLVAILLVALVGVPALGNLRPDLVSFLPAMRYYAGNWGTSAWLFRKGSLQRLDDGITKIARTVPEQLRVFYDEEIVQAVLGKAQAFRAMHLHGRAISRLLPRAVDDLERYEYQDGEVVAGVVLGWNFGDGHLHHEQLLAAVQAQVGFDPGELRCLILESQPMGRPTLAYRIVDAANGELERGTVEVRGLLEAQPWDGLEASSAVR